MAGLCRSKRKDSGTRKVVNAEVKKLIEGLALQKPAMTKATIHSEAMLGVLSLFISRDRRYASQQTKDGLERAKAQGQVLGRPSKFEQWKPQIIEMKAMGYSQGEMSRNTGLSYNTVKTYLKRIKTENNS